jgi:hypothetical protein
MENEKHYISRISLPSKGEDENPSIYDIKDAEVRELLASKIIFDGGEI